MRRKDRFSLKEKQRRRHQALFHKGKAVCVNSSGKSVVVLGSDLATDEVMDEPVNEIMYGLKIGDSL